MKLFGDAHSYLSYDNFPPGPLFSSPCGGNTVDFLLCIALKLKKKFSFIPYHYIIIMHFVCQGHVKKAPEQANNL